MRAWNRLLCFHIPLFFPITLFLSFFFLLLLSNILLADYYSEKKEHRGVFSSVVISDVSFEFERKKEEFPKIIVGTAVALTVAIPLSLVDTYVKDLATSYKMKDLGEIMSFLGEGTFLVPFSVAGYIFGMVTDNEIIRLGFIRTIYNLTFTTLVVQSLKFLGRERPGWAENQYSFSTFGTKNRWRSFPSGHSQASSSVYFTLGKKVCETKLCSAIFYSLPFIVGVGRILVNDHWFSDVAGGIIIGFSFEVF